MFRPLNRASLSWSKFFSSISFRINLSILIKTREETSKLSLIMKVTKAFCISYSKLLKSINQKSRIYNKKKNWINKPANISINYAYVIEKLTSSTFTRISILRIYHQRWSASVDAVKLKGTLFHCVLMSFSIISSAQLFWYFFLWEK